MNFELLVKGQIGNLCVTLTPFLAEEISETYEGKGQITLGVTPATSQKDDFFETICDFELTEAIVLRDALSALIGYLDRHH